MSPGGRQSSVQRGLHSRASSLIGWTALRVCLGHSDAVDSSLRPCPAGTHGYLGLGEIPPHKGGPLARVRIPPRCPALPGRGLRGPVTEECAVEVTHEKRAVTVAVTARPVFGGPREGEAGE